MSRTDISAASLADYLRRKAGDGSMEWCYEPMQTSVLLDMADMLDENDKLRELVRNLLRVIPADVTGVVIGANTDHPTYYKFDEAFRELGMEV